MEWEGCTQEQCLLTSRARKPEASLVLKSSYLVLLLFYSTNLLSVKGQNLLPDFVNVVTGIWLCLDVHNTNPMSAGLWPTGRLQVCSLFIVYQPQRYT